MILKNALVMGPAGLFAGDVYIKDGLIEDVEAAANEDEKTGSGENEAKRATSAEVCGGARDKDEVIDCGGKVLLPGFIDAHVHLREPGFEAKETIETGTAAAAAGGFTTVMPMPNLKPVPDSPEVMDAYMKLIREKAGVRVEPYASISFGEKGAEVVDMEALLKAGAAAFSDDGVGVQDGSVMKAAMEKAKDLGVVIAAHTEDNSLKNGGCVHLGAFSERMGLRGIPSACEWAQVERDIELVRQTGAKYHVCHVSAKETIDLVRKAKAEGLPVTCEVTPHHLISVDEDVKDANWKMNPPLRAAEDREALIEALIDGTADIVATDHAPHTREEKSKDIGLAPFGIVGSETAFPLLYTNLVKTGRISLRHLVEAMTKKPAGIFGFKDRGEIAPGLSADLVLVDLDKEYVIDPETFKSKGRNTPYGGLPVYGKILWTMAEGKVIYNA